MPRLFTVSLLPMCSLFLPMWIAIHMGRNREHIGSKETVKSLRIERAERSGPQGRRLTANHGGLPLAQPKLLILKHLQRHSGPSATRSLHCKAHCWKVRPQERSAEGPGGGGVGRDRHLKRARIVMAVGGRANAGFQSLRFRPCQGCFSAQLPSDDPCPKVRHPILLPVSSTRHH
jgi:hypothetical protein